MAEGGLHSWRFEYLIHGYILSCLIVSVLLARLRTNLKCRLSIANGSPVISTLLGEIVGQGKRVLTHLLLLHHIPANDHIPIVLYISIISNYAILFYIKILCHQIPCLSPAYWNWI